MSPPHLPLAPPRLALPVAILLLAAFLRFHNLQNLPPGWRDDEIVETTLHAQIVLDGGRPLFFVQAEGHEPLYHYLAAGLIALIGNGLMQVRLLSAFSGLLSVAALWRLARRWFGTFPAAIASLTLALSFWSLMYSRAKTRHVSLLLFALLTLYLFQRLSAGFRFQVSGFRFHAPRFIAKHHVSRITFHVPSRSIPVGRSTLFALPLALALHTYFAARALPPVLLAFVVYLAAFHRQAFRARWRGIALGFALAAALSLPMFLAERAASGGADRLSVVGAPLQALLAGDPRPVLSTTLGTLGMFAFRGDPEALYNLPGRPVFEAVGALLFALGLLVCLARWREPRHALLLIWLAGGLAPAFASTPAASLGHAILAQPATYIFPALALDALRRRASRLPLPAARALLPVACGLYLALTATRDLRDYFVRWPADPQVRHLYRASLHETAAALRQNPPAGLFLVSSINLDPRDPVALRLDAPDLAPRARFFDPARAFLFPGGSPAPIVLTAPERVARPFAGYYSPPGSGLPCAPASTPPCPPAPGRPARAPFANGLIFTGLDAPAVVRPGETVPIITHWQAGPGWTPLPRREPYDPTRPPVGLKVFLHLSAPGGSYLAGADDLGVEPSTLQSGDLFLQLHSLTLPADLAPGDYPLAAGLYDPFSGERVPLPSGADALDIGMLTVAGP